MCYTNVKIELYGEMERKTGKVKRMRKMRESKFRVPNALIFDNSLSNSAKRVGLYLYAHHNAQGHCTKSVEELSHGSGVSSSTAVKAIVELRDAGYIRYSHTVRSRTVNNRPMWGKNRYYCACSCESNYTFLPRSIFKHFTGVPAQFMVLVYIFYAAGNVGRAFPSIKKISEAIGVARSSVANALRMIKVLPEIFHQYCMKKNGAYAANSYWLCHCVTANNTDTTSEDSNSVDLAEMMGELLDQPQSVAKSITCGGKSETASTTTVIISTIRRVCNTISASCKKFYSALIQLTPFSSRG